LNAMELKVLTEICGNPIVMGGCVIVVEELQYCSPQL